MDNNSALTNIEIVQRLRAENLSYEQRGISWSIAKEINIDFAKFLDVPEGVFDFELLLKVWNKKYPCLHCYFVDLNNEDNLYFLTAFKARDNSDKFYSSTKNRLVDFSNEPLGSIFKIEVALTKKTNRPLWISGTKIN